MKIIVYTVTDCKFSQAEKEYLKSHNLPFEERNLETKHEYLSEMLTISDNFAGTPVTVIEKDQEDKGPQMPSGDNAHKIVLKGFTEEEFDNALGFTEEEDKEVVKKEPEVKEPEETAKKAPQDNKQPEQSTAPAQAQQAQPAPTQPNAPTQSAAPQQQVQQQTTAPQGMPDAPSPSMPQNPPVPPPAPAQPAAPQPPQQQVQQQPQIEVDPSLPGVPDAPSNVTDDSLDAILKDLQVKANEANNT